MSGALVGIVVGSESDLVVMGPAMRVLREMGVSFEVDICSAHRSPEKVATYARTARERGLEVIIAGAGKAAHLPGMIASLTMLPVVGVPLATPPLGGLDALYSIVQMPAGVPVAAVGIDAAENGALLAVRILAHGRPELAAALDGHGRAMREKVDRAAAAVRRCAGQAAEPPGGEV